MEKHIRLLAEVAADWLTIHPIRKDFYLKLKKTMELNTVVDQINKRLKEEERSWDAGTMWMSSHPQLNCWPFVDSKPTSGWCCFPLLSWPTWLQDTSKPPAATRDSVTRREALLLQPTCCDVMFFYATCSPLSSIAQFKMNMALYGWLFFPPRLAKALRVLLPVARIDILTLTHDLCNSINELAQSLSQVKDIADVTVVEEWKSAVSCFLMLIFLQCGTHDG